MHNLPPHKGEAVRQVIEATGAALVFRPLNTPDFDSIEIAFAKLKVLLRKAAERTGEGLWRTIGTILDVYPRRMQN